MTSPVTIDRFAVRWRLAEPANAEPARRILDQLVADTLPAALGGVVARDELVALSTVEVPPVRLPAGAPAGEAARVWAEAVAGAVAEAVAAGDRVVRYRSRRAAIADLVLRAAAGDLGRVWAWQRMGLWPAGDRTPYPARGTAPASSGALLPNAVVANVAIDDAVVGDAVVAALTAEPSAIAAVLAAAARTGRLDKLLGLLGWDRLWVLATRAWAAVGAALPDARSPLLGAAPWEHGPDAEPRGHGLLGETAARLLATSSYAGNLARAIDPMPGRALAALALAETEPGLLRAGYGPALLAAALAASTSTVDGSGPARSTARPGRRVTARPTAEHPPTPERPLPAEETTVPPDPPHTGRVARTRHAGLLFCLHLVDPDALLTEPVFGDTGLRFALHRLGAALVTRSAPRVPPPEPTDPALLAFAGLAPGSAAPDGGGDVGDTSAAGTAVERHADAVEAALRRRLRGRVPENLPAPALLTRVLRRTGEVLADPGWIDVLLDMDEVNVDLRAAGLDLDPGWLSWLGCVVRFRYVGGSADHV